MLKTLIFLTFYLESCFLGFHIFEDGGEDIWRTVHLFNLKFAVHICATNLNDMNAGIFHRFTYKEETEQNTSRK